jgi:hypothetical protein
MSRGNLKMKNKVKKGKYKNLDFDNDGKVNGYDCYANNKNRQDNMIDKVKRKLNLNKTVYSSEN